MENMMEEQMNEIWQYLDSMQRRIDELEDYVAAIKFNIKEEKEVVNG